MVGERSESIQNPTPYTQYESDPVVTPYVPGNPAWYIGCTLWQVINGATSTVWYGQSNGYSVLTS